MRHIPGQQGKVVTEASGRLPVPGQPDGADVLEHLPQVPADPLPQPQADLPRGLLEGQPVQEILHISASQGRGHLPAVGAGAQRLRQPGNAVDIGLHRAADPAAAAAAVGAASPVPVPDAGGHLARPAWRQRPDIGMGKELGQPDPEHLALLVQVRAAQRQLRCPPRPRAAGDLALLGPLPTPGRHQVQFI